MLAPKLEQAKLAPARLSNFRAHYGETTSETINQVLTNAFPEGYAEGTFCLAKFVVRVFMMIYYAYMVLIS